jgi:hypothetical protein
MDDVMLQAVDNQLNNVFIDVDEPEITHIEVTKMTFGTIMPR